MERLEAVGDFVLCEKIEATYTQGGIVLPETAGQSWMPFGRAVKVGPGAIENGVRCPIDVEVGDVVWVASPVDLPTITVGTKELKPVRARHVVAKSR